MGAPVIPPPKLDALSASPIDDSALAGGPDTGPVAGQSTVPTDYLSGGSGGGGSATPAASTSSEDDTTGPVIPPRPSGSPSGRGAKAGKTAPTPVPKPGGSFAKAFATARKGGLATFMWQGKKYTTKLKGAGSAPAPSAPAKPSVPAAPTYRPEDSPSIRSAYGPGYGDTAPAPKKFAFFNKNRDANQKFG